MASPTHTDKLIDHSVYMIGRAAPQKDPLFFVHVVQEMRRLLDNVEYVWIGDGDPKQIELLKRHDIRVTGWLDQGQMTKELSRAGAYIHSAAYEGFPLSVLDAASQGVPIIARDIPCFEGTPVVRHHSPIDLAHKAVDVLTDLEERKFVIARGYELLNHMNESNQAKALERAYAECGS
ncbi:glycosyltransferase [Kocuria flava]|uniref:glycosyltransferase n=1 Tax=Kocuria flava TaxID=446860 RepID=UPI0015DFE329|nr:glycosyltransferase [Kocuria flava]